MTRTRATQKRWIVGGIAAFASAGLVGGAAAATAAKATQPARLVSAVSAVGARTGAAVVAADTPTTTPTDPASPTTSPAEPSQARGRGADTVIDALVADGTLTKEQGDKVKAALQAARPSWPAGGPRGPGGWGPGRGPGGPAGGFGDLRRGGQSVADALGITTDQLRTELQSGKSLADVATAHGKTTQDVVDALVKEATTRLDAEVTAGRLTRAQADQMLATAKSMIDTIVSTPLPTGGFGGPFHPGLPGFPGDGPDDGPEPAAPATTAPSPTTTTN